MNNIVVIGTSRGIGKELVLLLAENKDYQVHALSRNNCVEFDRIENIHFHTFNLDSSKVKEDAIEIFSKIGEIDYMVNNAGKLINKPFLELTSEDIQSCYQTNILGVIQSMQAAVGYLNKNGSHVVNISSMGGFQGSVKFPGLSVYSTSKAALCSFTELFSEEFKDTKIAMNCLCLGAVQTEMLEEAFPGYEAPHKPKEMATFIADFLENGYRFYRGKILPVSISTP
jgi:NAD(P)-dependent dehydrogenase (short-subunit alcohol dehydrogenase family)